MPYPKTLFTFILIPTLFIITSIFYYQKFEQSIEETKPSNNILITEKEVKSPHNIQTPLQILKQKAQKEKENSNNAQDIKQHNDGVEESMLGFSKSSWIVRVETAVEMCVLKL